MFMNALRMIPTDSSNIAPLYHQNAESLVNEINWFIQIVNKRLHTYFGEDKMVMTGDQPAVATDTLSYTFERTGTDNGDINPPDFSNDHSVYAEFVKYYQLNKNERLLLILALIPHVQPQLLDVFYSVNKATGRGYTEFGGIKGTRHGGFIPTIETALFVLGGNDLSRRFRMYKLFEPDHIFSGHNIISIDPSTGSEPFYSSAITISEEFVDFFTTGHFRKPQFSMEFPARRLTTSMEWKDLVVDDFTAHQLDELRIWLQHGNTLMDAWDMKKKIKPGYKVLFHGPPGTGKTMAAALLGKVFNLDVYRVDLSMVISKYIGETEKNLEKVFKRAENKNWILFFDEADALFGKRTNISDSHDKYANQEIAYLLQRLESYPGLVILASNMRANVDEAFTRRLQCIIHFQKPQFRERARLWTQAFSAQSVAPPREELERIAQQYELSGGSIINIVQYASLMALSRDQNEIAMEDILAGIKKEYRKEGKTM
jgi:hypothetical protein